MYAWVGTSVSAASTVVLYEGSGGVEPQSQRSCFLLRLRIATPVDTDDSLRSSYRVGKSGLGRSRTTDLSLVKAAS